MMVSMPMPLSGSRRRALDPARALVSIMLLAVLLGTLLVASGGGAAARTDPGGVPLGGLVADDAPPLSASRVPATVRRAPAFAARVPASTRQVVRTVRTNRWCRQRYCTVTQAWRRKVDGTWTMLRRFRSTIGPRGFGKRREGDLRSPSGVYRVKVTFSTGRRAPGAMPWRRRLPTSNVSNAHNRFYNTWVEERWRTDGDRPSMRWGFVVDYNNVRMRPGSGPKPVVGKGSGIFYHTSRPGQPWAPTLGCIQLGNPRSMRWVVRWLRPEANPRVVQAR
jgi:L,D-peptidoglycan transpeptidase YkuD (ErfK/YbiS/YcfS/YnhG family)